MLTLQEVIADIEETNRKRDLMSELTPENQKILSRRDGTFEAVLTGCGEEKCLIPESGSIHYLYRGQNEEVNPCIPTIYRGNPTDIDIFVERMRLVVFQRLLESHPVVKDFFHKHHFRVDVEGLAQHYGLKTEVLDLTSKLDVAIFFAVCKYDKTTDTYSYYDDGETHSAVIYVFDPILDNEPTPSVHFENYMQGNIMPIGLQAFQRPGAQFGYALHIGKEKSTKSWMYEFTFTSEESKHYYDQFKQGEQLWVKDGLISKTKAIATQKKFSFKVFGEAYDKYPPRGYSKTKMIKALREASFCFETKYPDVRFTPEESQTIVDDWNKNIGPELAQKIVRKSWFEHEGLKESDDKWQEVQGVKKQNDYRTLKQISKTKLIELVAHPEGPEKAIWRNYTDMPRPQEKIRPTEEGLHKIQGHFTSVFGKPFLSEDDFIISVK